jgi:predicted DNA repair protein MutK
MATIAPLLINVVVGLVAGALVLAVVTLVKRFRRPA